MPYVHGGKLVARALKRLGVTHIFTLCGGHVQAIYDGCLDEDIRVVDVRHEQTAAHAADAWARLTGIPGVAVVTAGPGVTDAVTAVATAYRAQVPMVLIGGQAPLTHLDMGALQEMDHLSLLRPITKAAWRVHETRRLPEYMFRAFQVAAGGVPGPVYVEMPLDVLFNQIDDSLAVWGAWKPVRLAPDPDAIAQAAELLRQAHRPVLVVGSQWWWSSAREGLRELVEGTGLPVYVNGMARGALGVEHPSLFHLSRSRALSTADVVVLAGAPLDFRLQYGQKLADRVQLVQIDLDAGAIGQNRTPEVAIVGDIGQALRQLARKLEGFRVSGAWIDTLREAEARAREHLEPEIASAQSPVNPLRVAAELDRMLTERTILVMDGGDFVGAAARVLRPRGPGLWLDPGPLGTLGAGPGYAMAARLARPDHEVIILYGDGSFGLHAMEFEAMVRQRIKVIGIIGNDAAWTQILRGQVAMYGPQRVVATRLAEVRYERLVEALGGWGLYVERPEELRPALERALGEERPGVINVRIGATQARAESISF